ncbi:hypothetical protein DENSPDRAFT_841921 [Dentipellis sp. KUC8613]|nr:hypothetical protein DENSPDRAFT_841921 [Dentipellis sp. KUC8613]
MISNSSCAPLLDLDIPSSPLLSSSASDTVFSPSVLSRFTARSPPSRIQYSGAILSYLSTESASNGSLATTCSDSDGSLSGALHGSRSLPQITITRPLSEYDKHKPLPPVPPPDAPIPVPKHAHPPARKRARPRPALSPKQVIALLDLLDRADRDLSNEVQRVQESIRDACGFMEGWREQRREYVTEYVRRRERERRETKGPDSDFWLGV